jgi:hypothetical protein
MKEHQINLARRLYDEWFGLYPETKNPSEINTEEKAMFLLNRGWNNLKLMQTARKQGFEFTKRPKDRKDQTLLLSFK